MAFTTNHSLFKFCIMPFELWNAPAICQCLMQQILSGLNLPDRPDFVSVCLDTILIFSLSLEVKLGDIKKIMTIWYWFQLQISTKLWSVSPFPASSVASMSPRSANNKPKHPLEGLRDISLSVGWILDPCLPCSALCGTHCLSREFTWSTKLAPEK